MPELDLSIIIVNWNSADYVRKCLTSIFENTHNLAFEVIVVDSGSFDKCRTMVEEGFPQVRFIQSPDNIGFGRANNLGYNQSSGSYLLFLNPDTVVVGRAIETLLQAARTLPGAGAIGCKLLNSDLSLQTSCIQSFPTIINQLLDSEVLRGCFPMSRLWGIAPLHSKQDKPAKAESISGACIIMKREVFAEVGLFSSDYFMYAEDVDLCYKCQRTGYVNYHLPNATVIHFGDGAVRRAKGNFAVVMGVESIWRFMKKWRGACYAGMYRQSLLVAALIRLGILAPRQLFVRYRASSLPPSESWLKWRAILRWAVGLERWILKYR